MTQTKRMIAKPNERGWGIDVGWRVYDREGLSDDVYWGNTKDADSLRSAIEDARRRGYEFVLDESVLAILEPIAAGAEGGQDR